MSTIRFPFKDLFGKVAAAFRHKDRKLAEHHKPQPLKPKSILPIPEFEPRRGFAAWLLTSDDNSRNIFPGGGVIVFDAQARAGERFQ